MLYFRRRIRRRRLSARRTLSLHLVLILLLVNGALAIPPTDAIPDRLMPDKLARFELVLGRLQLSPDCFRIGSAHAQTTLEDGRIRTRSLAVSIMKGKPTLQFRDQGGDNEILLSFKAEYQVDIQTKTGTVADRQTLSYHQPSEGPIRARVEFSDGRAPIEFIDRSLWHIALKEPEFIRDFVEPLLISLEPTWNMDRSTQEIRAQLAQGISLPPTGPLADKWIRQLNSETASERAAATRALSELGVAGEFPLRESLRGELSNQQRSEIYKLLIALHPSGNDTPMRVAVWLSGEFGPDGSPKTSP